jgi:hypothetical protein
LRDRRRLWGRIGLCVAQRADAPLGAITEFPVALGRQIIFETIDRVAADCAIPGSAIVRAYLINATLGVIAVIAIREVANVALVLADFVAAAGAVPGPIILTTIIIYEAPGIGGVRRARIGTQKIDVAAN